MKPILLVMIGVLLYSCSNYPLGTSMKKVPIVCDDPYRIQIWVYNVETNVHEWTDIMETGEPGAADWYLNSEMILNVERYDTRNILFIRGFADCADTTRVTVYGSMFKEIIKDKPDFRKQIFIDGGEYTFGTPKPDPE